jgi:hypothetical protein
VPSDRSKDATGCLFAIVAPLPLAYAAALLADRLSLSPLVALVLVLAALFSPGLVFHLAGQQAAQRRAALVEVLAQLRLQRELQADPSAAQADLARTSHQISTAMAGLGETGAAIPVDDLGAVDSEIERLSARLAFERGTANRSARRQFVWSLVLGTAISIILTLLTTDQ